MLSRNGDDVYDQLLSKSFSSVTAHCLTVTYKMGVGQTLNIKTLDSDGKVTVLRTLSSPRAKPDDSKLKLAATKRAELDRYYCLRHATVPTFNSCTKCVGSSGRIHDRTPDCPPIFLCMDVYMTSQLILALIRNLRVS